MCITIDITDKELFNYYEGNIVYLNSMEFFRSLKCCFKSLKKHLLVYILLEFPHTYLWPIFYRMWCCNNIVGTEITGLYNIGRKLSNNTTSVL